MELNDFDIVNIILPKRCLHCNVLIESKSYLCTKCYSKITNTTTSLLKKEFNRKFLNEKLIDDFFAPFIFTTDSPLQTLIHNIKYEEAIFSASYIAGLLFKHSKSIIDSWQADFIVPMPLHPVKKAERGYNQVKLISNYLGKKLSIRKYNKVKRKKFTATQTKLNMENRKENVLGAFEINNSKGVENNSFIIFDDVITTGSTVTEVAKVLKENKAKNIFALSVAIAE